jgi:hypothetical protein
MVWFGVGDAEYEIDLSKRNAKAVPAGDGVGRRAWSPGRAGLAAAEGSAIIGSRAQR